MIRITAKALRALLEAAYEVQCDNCDGSGVNPNPSPCPECEGAGGVSYLKETWGQTSSSKFMVDCNTCQGSGEDDTGVDVLKRQKPLPCAVCKGKGRIEHIMQQAATPENSLDAS